MILDEYIIVKITKRNLDYYLNFYKDIKLKDQIKINPSNLQKSSNQFINVKCDLCNTQRRIKYQAYTKNINSCPNHPIYTCDKCSHIKIRDFNKSKWGVDYFSQTSEYLSKFKKTMLERWGVEHALQSHIIKDKLEKTNIEKFGYKNPFMDNGRIKEKFQEKWGVDHPSKVPEFVEKIKKSTKKNWDENKELRLDKFRNTNLDKWGSDHPLKSDLIRNSKITKEPTYISYLNGKSLLNCDLDREHNFEISSVEYHNRKRSNLPLCTICHPIGDSRSIKELELFNYIKSIYLGEIIQSYRDGLEIDIYLPELKLGFEFNGLYWHSEIKKDKNYHLNKTKYFSDRGIRLIHIWEDDWDNKRVILESQIKNWIGISDGKIFARKCKIIQLDSVSKFLNENHIQGSDKSSIKLGLEYGGEIVSVMTFNNLEGRKKMGEGEWNLSRFCNRLGNNVIGGASKLLSHFIREFSPTRIISYGEKYWSRGDLYLKLGFNLVDTTRPDYKYIVNNMRVHKSNFRKSKMKYSCTESEFTESQGINKIWDCGKLKFEKIIIN